MLTNSVDSIIEEHAVDLLRCGSDLKTLLASRLPSNQLDVPRDTEYVFRSIGNLFVELSKIKPMLLVIDDIHWADKSSIILLRHNASSTIIARQDADIAEVRHHNLQSLAQRVTRFTFAS